MARRKRTPTYSSWNAIIQRCTNPNAPGYENYGGRGIRVCKRWLKFKNFLADMGERPAGTTIDRFPNNNGNYIRSNCRWATRSEQQSNTRVNNMVTFRGQTLPLKRQAERFGIATATVYYRLSRGVSMDRALTMPLWQERL